MRDRSFGRRLSFFSIRSGVVGKHVKKCLLRAADVSLLVSKGEEATMQKGKLDRTPSSRWRAMPMVRHIRSRVPMPGSSRAGTSTGRSGAASDTICRRKRRKLSPRQLSRLPGFDRRWREDLGGHQSPRQRTLNGKLLPCAMSSSPTRWPRASNQPHPLQTRMPVLADDDVVMHGNAKRAGDVDDRFRHLDIGLRRRRVAGGMVVHQDQGGCG